MFQRFPPDADSQLYVIRYFEPRLHKLSSSFLRLKASNLTSTSPLVLNPVQMMLESAAMMMTSEHTYHDQLKLSPQTPNRPDSQPANLSSVYSKQSQLPVK
ncbi:unnamed protein product [Cyberlindnera jadinii]|uniref:Uncharacterized protein n=1 Tax=Cyberlindnera jadinii (strain ATCC 18201 / CBS 1600 / BCRC 20928 / JCM 3617 / NBRC 0987 / NRRL Y-1542) TaxID=983966 RepID=A0A0H5CHB9_CYBJN|nr:unnamed protein product [Cyberlindnera jadinii]